MTSSVVASPLSHLVLLGLLVLSHLDTALTCRPGTLAECLDTDINFVPGYKFAGEGYDVVTLEHRASILISNTPTENCNLCKNAHMKDELQKIPYYIRDWHAPNFCRRDIVSSSHTSVSSVAERSARVVGHNWQAGLKLKHVALQLAGSKSQVYSFASSLSQSDQYSFYSNVFTCSYYSFRLYSRRPPLSQEFMRTITSLPRVYSSNTTGPYQSFIHNYGTHYIREVRLGVRMRRLTALRTCLATLNQVSASQVEDCLRMGLSVRLGLSVDLGLGSLWAQCSKVMSSHDRVTGFQGGYMNHFTEGSDDSPWIGEGFTTRTGCASYSKWLKRMKQSPEVVLVHLTPLHLLVKDTAVKANLERAITEYVMDNGIGINDTRRRRSCGVSSPDLSLDCCPLVSGRGRLTVNVERAFALKGDWPWESDAYVKMWYGGQYRQTHTIRSYDPLWYSHYDFGPVDTHHSIRLEVWDRDWFHDENLGGCTIDIEKGTHGHNCGLHRGDSLSFYYTLTCDPYLMGYKCDQYAPSPN